MEIYICLDSDNTICQWSTSPGIGDDIEIKIELPDDHEFFNNPCTWYKYESSEVVRRNKDEIEKDIDLRPHPPTLESRISELENALLSLMLERIEGGEK